MKIIMFFLSLLAMLGFSIPGHAEDAAKKALDDAGNYTASGEYAKALERYEWFHENALSVSRSYYGVRLSFALSGWKHLGDLYPPAMASLKATRDADVRALKEGTGSYHDFTMSLASIMCWEKMERPCSCSRNFMKKIRLLPKGTFR